MHIGLVIIAIILIAYTVFTLRPQLLPASIWKQGFVRKANRANIKMIEGIVGNSNVIPMPIQSYYKTYSQKNHAGDTIIVGLHYTDWCGYCKLMKPVWYEIKQRLSTQAFSAVIMFENNEEMSPTPGIDSYPTIYKMRNGLVQRYQGRADIDQLTSFILGTNNPTNQS